jgi:hypothetical protein
LNPLHTHHLQGKNCCASSFGASAATGLIFLVSLVFFPFPLDTFRLEAAEEICRTEDASDRNYHGRILELIHSAQRSIDLALFAVNVRPVPDDPGYQLVQALMAASESGKKVRLWLNARQASIGANQIFMRADLQAMLEAKGIRIFYVDPRFRLHDKLIVIDRKIVVDGSMNWTREALLKNFESVSVIHAPALAESKIKRLESFPIFSQPAKTQKEISPAFPFPLILLKDPEKFPSAVEDKEIRSLALYLVLLDQSRQEGKETVVIHLDKVGEELPFKKRWIGSSLRHEMRRNLNFLKAKYQVLDWQEIDKNEITVTLTEFSGSEKIMVPSPIIEAGYLKTLTPTAIFTYLIVLHKSAAASSDPFWIGSVHDIAEEFHLNPVTLIRGLWELRRANLIEIFPSEKKEIGGRWKREFTNRYALNPILNPGERVRDFDGLRKKFGGKLVEKARKMADSIDEPEDTEVTRQFVHLLAHYPEKEVEEATRIVSGFNRNNPLRTPAYIRGILEGGVK